MLNFRQELNQILDGNDPIRHQAEFILENVLQYFRNKPKEELEKIAHVELEFAHDKDKICVKENSGEEKEIFCFMFSDLEAIPKVLCYIESELLREGFMKMSSLNAKQHGRFKVKNI